MFILVREIQESNVQKKQLLCKLLLENPDLVKSNPKSSEIAEPNLEACLQAVENTPGLVSLLNWLKEKFNLVRAKSTMK